MQNSTVRRTWPLRNRRARTGHTGRHSCAPALHQGGREPLDEVKVGQATHRDREPRRLRRVRDERRRSAESWSQLATDIVVSKYFRKAGLPRATETNRRAPVVRTGSRAWRASPMSSGATTSRTRDAEAFEAELATCSSRRSAAFNRRCGSTSACSSGTARARAAATTRISRPKIKMTTDSNAYPRVSACFIQSVNDDLMSIFDLVKNEARVFKFGSGTGTNFSARGAWRSSRAAGVVRPHELPRGARPRRRRDEVGGGTTRRAAKMVVLDMDHPEIVDFMHWKMREEEARRAHRRGLLVRTSTARPITRSRPELEQLDPRARRVHARASRGRRQWSDDIRTDRRGLRGPMSARDLWRQVAEAAWSLRRPGHPVRRHDQKLAHVPERRTASTRQPVLRVHVPRRHGLQPRVDQPDEVPR